MPIIETVLLIVMLVLVIVLIAETREYRRARTFTASLENAIDAYTAAFNSMSLTVGKISQAFEQTTDDHKELADELSRQGALLELHNRALSINPRVLMTLSDDEEGVA